MVLVLLRSKEGRIFNLNAELLPTSKKIKNMIETNSEEVIKLPEIECDCIEKIIEWNAQNGMDSIPEGRILSEEQNKKIQERYEFWQNEFLKIKTPGLAGIIQVSKSLEMEELAEEVSSALANRLTKLVDEKDVEEFFKDLDK